MNDNILYPRNQRFRDEKIVNAPANATLAGGKAVGPPGILDAIRVKMAVRVHKAMVEELLSPRPLLRPETGVCLILFRVFQVYWHVDCVEVAGTDDGLTHCMQPVAHSQQMSIEIQFIVQALLAAALPIREVNVE